jgi:hypothetical protein
MPLRPSQQSPDWSCLRMSLHRGVTVTLGGGTFAFRFGGTPKAAHTASLRVGAATMAAASRSGGASAGLLHQQRRRRRRGQTVWSLARLMCSAPASVYWSRRQRCRAARARECGDGVSAIRRASLQAGLPRPPSLHRQGCQQPCRVHESGGTIVVLVAPGGDQEARLGRGGPCWSK